jgi:hypothetical protein
LPPDIAAGSLNRNSQEGPGPYEASLFRSTSIRRWRPVDFPVGPTPRSDDVVSWRPSAIEILRRLEYDGTVLIPERQDFSPSQKAQFNYVDQVEWEFSGLRHCTRIAAWIPRCMQTMPALTSNVEFGYWLAASPERLIYGRPDGAPHTGYLDWMYEKFTGRKPVASLEELLACAAE